MRELFGILGENDQEPSFQGKHFMTNANDVSQKILDLCAQVTAKRPKTVIDHIIKHGQITTEELKSLYGYDHPPRAARDVREQGIPLETIRVVSERTNRRIGAYRFADPAKIKAGRIGGRAVFSKAFKELLVRWYDSKNVLTGERMEPRYLQIDHRIPYEVGGDGDATEENIKDFMLLDAASQRQKSWSCERCTNFTEILDQENCRRCYWAYPDDYDHVAMKDERRAQIAWQGEEVSDYEKLKNAAAENRMPVPDFLKFVLNKSGVN